MTLQELAHGLVDRRVLPVTGDFLATTLIAAIGATAESEVVKWLSAASVVVLLASRILALTLQVKGATARLSKQNTDQQEEINDLKARLAKVEGGRRG